MYTCMSKPYSSWPHVRQKYFDFGAESFGTCITYNQEALADPHPLIHTFRCHINNEHFKGKFHKCLQYFFHVSLHLYIIATKCVQYPDHPDNKSIFSKVWCTCKSVCKNTVHHMHICIKICNKWTQDVIILVLLTTTKQKNVPLN